MMGESVKVPQSVLKLVEVNALLMRELKLKIELKTDSFLLLR